MTKSGYPEMAHDRIAIALMLAVAQREILDFTHGSLSEAILGSLIAVVRMRNLNGADVAIDKLVGRITEKREVYRTRPSTAAEPWTPPDPNPSPAATST